MGAGTVTGWTGEAWAALAGDGREVEVLLGFGSDGTSPGSQCVRRSNPGLQVLMCNPTHYLVSAACREGVDQMRWFGFILDVGRLFLGGTEWERYAVRTLYDGQKSIGAELAMEQ